MAIHNITVGNFTFGIQDHGYTGESYFQGAGTSFTEYEHCSTGMGNSFRQAVEDALEMACQSCDGEQLTDVQTDTVCCKFFGDDLRGLGSDGADYVDPACLLEDSEYHRYVTVYWGRM